METVEIIRTERTIGIQAQSNWAIYAFFALWVASVTAGGRAGAEAINIIIGLPFNVIDFIVNLAFSIGAFLLFRAIEHMGLVNIFYRKQIIK